MPPSLVPTQPPGPPAAPTRAAVTAPAVTALGALMAAATVGESRLPAAWVPAPLARILVGLGARVRSTDTGVTVRGRGLGGLAEPTAPLDVAASPDGPVLLPPLAGLLATQPILVVILGPADMDLPADLIEVLMRVGARPRAAGEGRRSPLSIQGTAAPVALDLGADPPPSITPAGALAAVAAGLNSPGETRVPLPAPLAEALAALLTAFGVPARIAAGPSPPADDGPVHLCLTGEVETRPVDIPAGDRRFVPFRPSPQDPGTP